MCLHKFVKLVISSVPVRKFYNEQVFVLVRMQFHNHVDTQPVNRFERAIRCIYDIKLGTLQVRKNEIANALVVLRICAVAHLRAVLPNLSSLTAHLTTFQNFPAHLDH